MATRGDADGTVLVEVWTVRVRIEGVDLRPVYDGELLLTSSSVVVGNTVGNELHSIPLSAGAHHVRVFTSGGAARPDAVYFVVEA